MGSGSANQVPEKNADGQGMHFVTLTPDAFGALPVPAGTPEAGQVPAVTSVSPLALGWGAAATTGYADAAVGVETARALGAEALLAPQVNPTFGGTVTVPTPVAAGAAVTKAYADALSQGLSIKPSVTALAASNITLSGAQTIDGIAVTAGNRVLATGQSTASQNGIWTVASGAWARPADFASASSQVGAFSFVSAGTTYGGTGWALAGSAVTVDTTSETWTQFSSAGAITAGTGLSKTGNTLANTGVLSAAAADGSVVIGGTGSAPTVRTGTLDAIATAHPPVAAVAFNGQKATGLAYGSASLDAVTYGQLGTAVAAAQSAAEAASLPLPSGTPTSGQVPVVSTVSPLALGWGSGASGGALAQTALKTADYTASAGQVVPVSTAGGNVTITLPTAPAGGTLNAVKMTALGAGYAVTVATGGGDAFNAAGGPTALTLSLLNQGMLFQYNSGVWMVLADDLPLGALKGTYPADWYNVKSYGARIDGRVIADGAMTASSATFTSASSNFSSADVGKLIQVRGAGAVNGSATLDFNGSIAAYVSPTQVILSATAATTAGPRSDTGCGTTNGSMTVTDPSAASGDNGKPISGPNLPPGTTITSVASGTGYTVSASATAGASGQTFLVGGATTLYGSDDYAPVQAALNAAMAAGGVAYQPAGLSMHGTEYSVNKPVRWTGAGSSVIMGVNCAGVNFQNTYISNGSGQGTENNGIEFDHLVFDCSGGHVFYNTNINGLHFHDLYLVQHSPGYAVLYSSGAGANQLGWLWDNVISFVYGNPRSTPAFYVLSQLGGGFALCEFRRCTWQNQGGDSTQYLVVAKASGTHNYLNQLNFADCTFAQAYGGCCNVEAAQDVHFSGCGIVDTYGTTAGNSMYRIAMNPGSTWITGNVSFRDMSRDLQGPNGSATWDIFLDPLNGVVNKVLVENYGVRFLSTNYTVPADQEFFPYFNLGGATNVILIGTPDAVVSNAAADLISIGCGGVATYAPAASGTPAAGQVAVASGTGQASAWATLAAASATRSATLVVAASNATAKSKAAADYVCTGTADNTTIQTAIRAAIAAGGGKVILTEGHFHRDRPIYIDAYYVSLEGQGDATVISTGSGSPVGSAHIIIGSNGAYDGVVYTGGDSAPTALPEEVNVRNLLLQDYQSAGVALTGSASGLICRGSVVHISDVNVKGMQLDGLRFEGFRQMGTASGTVSAGGAGAPPAWGTSESWTVTMSPPPPLRVDSTGTSIASQPTTTIGDTNALSTDVGLPISGTGIPGGATITSVTPGVGYVISAAATVNGSPTLTLGGQFTCIVTPATGVDNDPEIVNVTAAALVSGTSYTLTVQRGWMQTTPKVHSIGDAVRIMTVTTTYNNVTRDCFVYSPLRSGIFTQQGLDDSEFVACIVNGGNSPSQRYTQYGIWAGGSNCRFIACHPYYCTANGYYGLSQTNGQPVHIIIGGEYETNGSAGISIQQAAHCCIEGNIQMYANGTYDVLLSTVTGFKVHDNEMYSPVFHHIQANNCLQGSIHDNIMTGSNSGYMISISGAGTQQNAEIDIHDNILTRSGSSYANAIGLSNVAGVRVHSNVCEEGIAETGTSDFNVITHNTMTSPVNGITVTGAHTRSYDNLGVSDYAYSTAATVNAVSDVFYQLDTSANAITFNPPGSGAGGTALAGGSVGANLPVSSITLTSQAGWPATGLALIPLSGGGYAAVIYTSISGATLNGCAGGTGTTIAGNAYICPDPSLKFKAVAPISTHAGTIAVPPGMTINGGSSPITMTTGKVYTGVLGITPAGANWAIY